MRKYFLCAFCFCLSFSIYAQSNQPRLIVGTLSGSNENDVKTVLSIVERQINAAKKFRVLSNSDYVRMGVPSPNNSSGQQVLQRERIDYVLSGSVGSTYTGYDLSFYIYDNNGSTISATSTFSGNASTEMYAGISDGVNNLIAQMLKSGKLAYAVGDRGPAGGWIFYDKGSYSDGWRYREVAPKEAEFRAIWGPHLQHKAEFSSVKTFKEQNTNIANEFKTQNISNTAVQLCINLRFGGYSDWYLPGNGDFNDIIENLNLDFYLKDGNPLEFSYGAYWTSSIFYTGVDVIPIPQIFMERFSERPLPDSMSIQKVRPVRQF
ncbi:MAG: hypothetical protein Ta2B_14910 [Termitinemataceae bacterium]|nr:MAG: hypothetical protein Ta2B_14910 [Termitinemataceae bacterium]